MKTVLIIESDPEIRLPLEEALRRDGYDVFGVAHGAAGLAAAKEYLPDLVLCADRLPGMDGCHVARLLRQDSGSGLPRFLLLLSGEASPFVQGFGIDGVLRLPAAPEPLLSAVAAQFENPDPSFAEPPPVPRLQIAEEKAPRAASEILDDLAGVTHDLLGMVEKFLKFTQVKAVLERRHAQVKKGGSGPRLAAGVVHSNQVGSLAQVAADEQGRADDLNCHLEKGFLPLELGELGVVVGELVENACRYSRPGAPIDVFYFRQGEGSEIMVRDYGAGMTAAEVEALRAPAGALSRIDPPPSLGLTMVRMIVESRGGRFLVHSVPEVGTTVRVLLPDLPPAERAAGDQAARGLSDLGVPPFEEGDGDPL